MSSPEDSILAKEIESWKGFEYALRLQHAEPFAKMLKECLENEEYAAASKSQGPQRSTESLFMTLIFQQQKMVSRLMKQIQSNQSEAAGRTNNIPGSGS
jgi:hypothetical protein